MITHMIKVAAKTVSVLTINSSKNIRADTLRTPKSVKKLKVGITDLSNKINVVPAKSKVIDRSTCISHIISTN